ncbi:sensor histidine kinase [Actinoplanes aureus]|uniref:sensor histidine kinase n=1 Tax=Actinoplanes aureus TaxID=2792083 RepID=UPI001E28BD2F|nr:nitrate- and nitrite sensing domain-containing protein [Actinoplanes aureus]
MGRTTGANGRAGHTIRGRIVRILALPVAAVLLLLSVVVAEELAGYRLAARTDRAITLDLAVQSLVQEVQTERGVTAGLLAGNAAFRAEVAPARQRVDREHQALRDLVADGDLDGQVTGALDRMAALPAVREDADAGGADRAEVFADYNDLIEDLGEVYFALDNAADAQTRLGSEALTMLNAAKEVTARQRAFLNGVFSAGGFRDGEFLQFVQLRSDRDIALEEFEEYATPTAVAAKNYLLSTGPATQALQYEQLALASGDGQPLQLDPQAWWSSLTTVLDDMSQLARHIGSTLKARAEVLRERADLRLAGLAAIVLLCIGGALYLATGAARSLAGPLSGLATEANRLAGERLPEAVRRAVAEDEGGPPDPVPIAGSASIEVRQVADALDRVQATAYALATEQARLRRTSAESLANLGRRNQNLLRRQLGFITSLEREESSPAGLANLFELDHLATRMRRNAESLLVLVGAASPRQWSGPLPLTDVIRAAVSEVEEYRRVSLRRLDEAMVAGSVVSGLAHLLAELIENGLVFSPPDPGRGDTRPVGGRRLPDRGLRPGRRHEPGRPGHGQPTAARRGRLHHRAGQVPRSLRGRAAGGRDGRRGRAGTVRGDRSDRPIMLPAGILAEPAALVAGRPPGEELPSTRLPRGTRPGAVEVDYVVVAERPAVPAPRRPLDAPLVETAPGVARTANGLRKRVPRAQRAPAAAAPTPPPEPAAPVTDSPEAIRTRLTALRDGIRRGAAQNPPARSL